MKYLREIIKIIAITASQICLSFCFVENAFTQNNVITEKGEAKAIQLIKVIKDDNLLAKPVHSTDQLNYQELPTQGKLRKIRQYAYDRISLSNQIEPQSIIELYSDAVNEVGTHSDKQVFQLHEAFLKDVDLSKGANPNKKLTNQLDSAVQSEDWFVASNAWLLKSLVSFYSHEPNISLQELHEAVQLIPNEISTHSTDSKILTLTHSTVLNNYLLNPELAIESTASLIKLKRQEGYPIDGSSLLNNLLYSLSKWREDEVSTHLSEAVLDIEKQNGSNTPGLTELRVAQLYDRQSNFEDALIFSRRGLKSTNIESVKESLMFLELNALIGLGFIDEANEIMSSMQNDDFKSLNKSSAENLVRAELGLAISSKDERLIYEKLNHLIDLIAQAHLRNYSANTATMLASLENTKERQAEREAGLKREADLQKSRAEQQKRANQLLWALVGLLSLAVIFAGLFARFRNKVSKELAIKTLEAEDADRMKSEFLGMVSHELRTPLNGIVGIADLLSVQAPTDDMRHKAGIILDSSNKLTHVIESIVDMSRIDGEKMELYPEPVNVHDIITELEQAWRGVLEEKGITFTCFIENSLTDEIILDKARFHQCLNNLLSNAAKFTDEGRVHLHVTSKTTDIDNQVEITAIVADTGQGMSEDVQGKLFTPFLQADSSMTRKHGGSGLGLAITQSLARMMDGDVTMISNQGRGSEFTMTVKGQRSESTQILDDVEALMDKVEIQPLETNSAESPIAKSEEGIPAIKPITAEYATIQAVEQSTAEQVDIDILAEPAMPASTPTPQAPESTYDTESLRGLNVLIVDDIPSNQDVIKLFLDPEGCKSFGALSGIEALNVLDTQAIDIILMDIRMPEMDGIEATRTIRNSSRDYKNTPIIALTADVSAETNAACMAAGADIFLSKPVMGRELIESIKFIRRVQDYEDNTATNVA